MSASNDNQSDVVNVTANPYAAPHAELTEPTQRLSTKDVLRSVVFGRRILKLLGVMRALGGIVAFCFAAAVLESSAHIIAMLLGVYNCLCGIGLVKCRQWGRELATVECAIQIVIAIALMALGATDFAGEGRAPVLLGLIPLVWNSAYLRVLFSPIAKAACRDAEFFVDRPKEHADQRPVMDMVLMVARFLGAFVFAAIGILISVFLILLARPGVLW